MADLKISMEALKKAFYDYYNELHRYAYTLIRSSEAAKDIVQQVFINLWEKRSKLNIEGSLKAYLYKAVHNYCINHNTRTRRHLPIKQSDEELAGVVDKPYSLEVKELEKQVKAAIEKLPPQCKTIFLKNREEEKTYNEVAAEMGIAVKTVEAHMSKALKILREELGHMLIYWGTTTIFFNLLDSI